MLEKFHVFNDSFTCKAYPCTMFVHTHIPHSHRGQLPSRFLWESPSTVPMITGNFSYCDEWGWVTPYACQLWPTTKKISLSSDCKYVSCQVHSTEFFKLHVCHWKLNACILSYLLNSEYYWTNARSYPRNSLLIKEPTLNIHIFPSLPSFYFFKQSF